METKEILSELNKEYKPVKISENDETSLQKADKFNAVRTIIYEWKDFLSWLRKMISLFAHLGTLLYRRGRCRIYLNGDASGNYTSGGYNRGGFGSIWESQEEGYVFCVHTYDNRNKNNK